METTEAEYLAWANEHQRTGQVPPIHTLLDLNVLRLSPSTLVTMALTDAVSGSVPGTVHGGLLATFADAASAFSIWDAYDVETERPVTTDMHVRYYRQPLSGPLTAEVSVVHKGRRLLSTECSVTDAENRVLIRSTATYMIVPFAGAAS
jgi:uncharacterized protein (TIGR00369 family)